MACCLYTRPIPFLYLSRIPTLYRAKGKGIQTRWHDGLKWMRRQRFQTTRHDPVSVQRKLPAFEEPVSSTSSETSTWTEEETERLRDLVYDGLPVWVIATEMRKTPLSIVQKIRGSDMCTALWTRWSIKGRFSSGETEFLIRHRRAGVSPADIALYLGRKETSVREKIIRESRRIEQTTTYHGPQDLTPQLEDSITRGRLQDAFADLLRGNMADYWRRLLLHQEQARSWLSVIGDNIPTPVKGLLASHEPPDIEQLEALPWTETYAPGVYGWLLKPTDRCHLSRDCYLYVGSASKPRYGLNWRKAQHLSPNPSEHNPRLLDLIRENKLGRKGTFVTLMSTTQTETDNNDNSGAKKYDALVTRHIMILAEALFAALFGACQPIIIDHNPHLQGLHPWGGDAIPWTGCCSHNPLIMDFVPPGGIQESVGAQELRTRAGATMFGEFDGRRLRSVIEDVTGGTATTRSEG